MCPSVTNVEALRQLVESAQPDELPALAGELARGLANVLARTAAPTKAVAGTSPRDEIGTLLTVAEAAARLGVAKSWLYRHAKTLPFARKLGHRTLRFHADGLGRWLVNQCKSVAPDGSPK
jgi:excisionase family DNA binding protein